MYFLYILRIDLPDEELYVELIVVLFKSPVPYTNPKVKSSLGNSSTNGDDVKYIKCIPDFIPNLAVMSFLLDAESAAKTRPPQNKHARTSRLSFFFINILFFEISD